MLAASNEWAWVPDGTPHVRTEEYLVVDTSSPILRRLGCTRYGEERTLVLDLS
ncbi:hypothetical protein [Terrabacter sp. BE26]|uniref:hypothetical protein n=1 Tax=Terrabacter sp. BE26 TaxID=2898152 RepID=UPI0035BE8FB3